MATREENIAYRYYRILWTGSTNSNYKFLYNWLLTDTVGGAHKPGIITASVVIGGERDAPEAAFDGDISRTGWTTPDSAGDRWLKLDYGSPILMKETSIVAESMYGGKWLLQGSNDDAVWTTLFDYSQGPQILTYDQARVLRYTIQKTKYRLNVLTTKNNNYLFLAEMYLLDENGQRIPSGRGTSYDIVPSTVQTSDPANAQAWTKITDNDPATQGVFYYPVSFVIGADVPAIGWAVRQGNRSDSGIKTWSLDRSDDGGVTWANIVPATTETDWANGELRERTFESAGPAKRPRRMVSLMYVTAAAPPAEETLFTNTTESGTSNDWGSYTFRQRFPVSALSDKTKTKLRLTFKSGTQGMDITKATIAINTGNTGFDADTPFKTITFGGVETKSVGANTEIETDLIDMPVYVDGDAILLTIYLSNGSYMSMGVPSGGGGGYTAGNRAEDAGGSGWNTAGILHNIIRKITGA